MKTIKMIADELGVTKQTIVNNAKRLNISFEKENGINYINDNDYLKIIEKITKKERTTQNKESSPDSCVKCYTMFLPFLLIKIDVFS
ncbi:hypothetical protein UE1_03197 [Enterococcus faecalis EnGen0251]|uniref:hypothetical protein n=1 Tax=Enterococcus faecalis TaxID=1351 RepID=UPI000330056D|nr:hypothetical protein UE1_03197 [Enterococcus faecalis EnGen0251]